MIWDDVCDSLDGAIRADCPFSQTVDGIFFDVPTRRGFPLLVQSSEVGDLARVRDFLAEIVQDLSLAHPFAFEDVPLEREGTRSVYPGCDPAEMAFFNEGLVPMPFPSVWFEFQAALGQTGLLAQVRDGRIDIVEFSRTVINGRTYVRVFPWYQQLFRSTDAIPEGVAVKMLTDASALPDRETRIIKGVLDPLSLYTRAAADEARRHGLDVGSDEANQVMLRESGFLVYLLVMLGSRSTEIETREPPKFTNRKRREKGLRPLPRMTTVRIIPRLVAERIRAEGGDIHASPRMHWRRSHLRTLSDGRRVVVSRTLVGFKALDGTEILEHRYQVA